jgi:hypothetical protein
MAYLNLFLIHHQCEPRVSPWPSWVHVVLSLSPSSHIHLTKENIGWAVPRGSFLGLYFLCFILLRVYIFLSIDLLLLMTASRALGKAEC